MNWHSRFTCLLPLGLGVCISVAPAHSQGLTAFEQTGGPYGGRVDLIVENPFSGELWASVQWGQHYVSSDGGETWSLRQLPGGYFAGTPFRSDGYIFVYGHRSPDNGITWEETNVPDSVRVSDLVIEEATGNVIVGTDRGLYYSQDSGNTWNVGEAFDRGLWEGSLIVLGGGYVFGVTQENPPRLLRSNDSGITWEERNPISLMYPPTLTTGPDSGLYVKAEGRLFRTSNQGDTWELLADLSPIGCQDGALRGFDADGRLIIQAGSLYRISTDFSSCDQVFDHGRRSYPESTVQSSRSMKSSFVDSQGHVFVGSGFGGFFRSIDGGDSWNLSADGIKNTNVNNVTMDNRTGVMLAGTKQNGVFRSSDHGLSWEYVGFIERSINKVAAGANPGEWWVATYHDGIHRSEDDGYTWAFLPNPFHKSIVKDFYYDRSSNTFFVRYRWGKEVFYSQDEGQMWTGLQIPHGINENDRVLAITVSHEGYLYVCVQEGTPPVDPTLKFYRTADLGTTWEEIPHSLPYAVPSESFVELFVDSTDRLWTATETKSLNAKLHFTNDDGVSWNLSLEKSYFDFAAFLETPDGSIWIADSEGTLRSSDRGQTWNTISSGLADLSVNSLAWDSQTERILAGSSGGSVYQTAVDISIISVEEADSTPSVVEIGLGNYPNPFKYQTTISYSLPLAGRVQIRVYNILAELVEMLEYQELPAGRSSSTFDATHLASGVYFYTLIGEGFSQTKKMVVLR